MIDESDYPGIVLVPDMQNMAASYRGTLETMMRWIADAKDVLNIEAVLGLGDNVNDPTIAAQWTAASAAWAIIDAAGLPYVPTIGNHDYNAPSTRTKTTFDATFPASLISGESWYGGSYSGSLDNCYLLLTIGGVDYLILLLELFPRAAVCTWASGVLAANSGRTVIVVTHGYQKTDGTLVVDGDTYGPNTYGLGADYSGQELWDNFITSEAQIRLVLNGHYIGGGAAQRHAHVSTVATGGNTVHQLFTDYQEEDLGGAGYLLLIQLLPTTIRITQIRVSGGPTFSAYWPAYELAFSPVS